MSKVQRSAVELVVQNHTSIKEMVAARTRRRTRSTMASRVDELEAISATVRKMREDLLDYNPVLAVLAEALQKAVELETESQRCNLILTANS